MTTPKEMVRVSIRSLPLDRRSSYPIEIAIPLVRTRQRSLGTSMKPRICRSHVGELLQGCEQQVVLLAVQDHRFEHGHK